MRNHPVFDKNIPKKTLASVRKDNLRVYITMKYFYERKYKRLIILIDKGTGLLAKFRFKKV